MLNKKVLLGSLVAGAFLLPMTANAGLVNGQCYNCHTMHQTDGAQQGVGTNRTGGPQLLVGDGCVGCHATGNGNDATGREAAGTIHAPQIDDAATPNAAGYFTRNNTADEVMHNVVNDFTADGVISGGTAPGGTADLTSCGQCHTASGGHHAAGDNYRMLYPAGTYTSADPNFGNSGGLLPDVSNTEYDSTAMNNKCGGCHGQFHGDTNQMSAGSWVRHPTDISLAAGGATYSYTANLASSGDAGTIPVGSSATGTDMLLCITCHYSHGGPNDNLLRWANYGLGGADNRAGDDVRDRGCESCHSYDAVAAAGNQPGM